jgi:hypothetical protein
MVKYNHYFTEAGLRIEQFPTETVMGSKKENVVLQNKAEVS